MHSFIMIHHALSPHSGPAKGDYSVQEGQIVPNTSWFIPRADVADFMLSSLNTPEWDRKCVAIGSKS